MTDSPTTLLGATMLGTAAVAGAAMGYALGRCHSASSAPGSFLAEKLECKGLRPGADTGNPIMSVKAFSPGNTKGAGLWECKPGGFPVVRRPTTETVLILSGKGTITNDDGTKVPLEPGTWHTLPTGWTGRWDVHETLRKLYVITP